MKLTRRDKIMNLKKVLLGLMGSILLLPQIALADGGIFPSPNKYITETDQKAVIIHENSIETMILSVNFKGDPEDFGWVIPVPSKPEVDKSQDELFSALAEWTAPAIEKKDAIPTWGLGESKTTESLSVDIIETEKIDIYDITIITSKDSKDLAQWLSKNEYQIPKNASTIFEDYTKNNWYYICVKVDLSKLTSSKEGQLQSGHATPLKIQFNSDQIIFPLKLTSTISEYESLSPDSSTSVPGLTPMPQVSILIYVFSDGKKTVPGFDISYANWLKKDDIEALAINDQGENWYKTKASKLYLTKFYRSMKTNEMVDDLVFRPASNNEAVGVAQSNTILNLLIAMIVFALTLIIILLSPVGLPFIILTIIQFLVKSRATRVVCWILQILVFLVTVLVVLVISLYGIKASFPQYSSKAIGYAFDFDWSNMAVMIAGLVAVITEVIVLIGQIKFQKRNCPKNIQDNPQKVADSMFEAEKTSQGQEENQKKES